MFTNLELGNDLRNNIYVNSFRGGLCAINSGALICTRSFISLVIILLICDYTVSPGVFIVKRLIVF